MKPIVESHKVTRSPGKCPKAKLLVMKEIRGKITRSKSRESKAEYSPDVS